jgi:hypothetical protein
MDIFKKKKKEAEILCYVMQSVVLSEYDHHHKGISIVSTLLCESIGRQQQDILLSS